MNRLIVVLGMHRSGTSAIARGLKVLGVELGDNLLSAAADNKKGFWEDRDFYDLNVEMMHHLGCDWHTLQPLKPSAFEREDLASFRLCAVELVRKKIEHASVFGVKDPRNARLLPFWNSVFAHLGVETGFIVVVRHPLSVARSLKTRNGFEEEKSHYLWLEHMIPGFLGSEGNPRVVVSYDRMMDRPEEQLRRIAVALKLPFDSRDENLKEYTEEFLEERLRHTRFQFEDLGIDPAVPKEVIEAYDLLEKLGRDELPIDSSEVRDRFVHWEQRLQELSPALRYMSRRDVQIADLQQIVSDRNAQSAMVNRELAKRDGQIASLTQSLADMETQIVTLMQRAGERDVEIASLNQAVAERDKQISTLSQAATERDVQVTSLNQAITQLHGQVANLNQVVSEREGEIASLNQAITQLHGQIANLNQIVSERDGQIARLNQAVVDLTEESTRRGEWALRLDSELKESQSNLTAILHSNSWRITLPLREARRWVNAPEAQSKRYAKAVLRRLKRTYQALPLSAQTKALHRNWIARHAPRLLLASSADLASIPTVSVSAPMQARLLPGEDEASTNAELVANIVLPTSDSPIVSIIVPVDEKIDYTLRCLKSIENQPPRIPFEVIVVDDSSPDNSAELVSKVSGIRLITNTENLGSIRSCNAGARAASGEYLLFLNNETEVTPGWTDKLLRTFDEFTGKVRVKIAAVTMVYNEALVLPYFLRHYRYLDEIHVLYETDSTDESLEILMQAPNVVIEKCHIEGGLDDIEKINLINKAVQRTKADWVYVVDPDEFVFPPNNESPHSFLKRQSCDVVRSGMFQVYRHRTDRDLDPSLVPVPQRAHGDSDLFSTDTEANRASNNVYIKPNIVRPSKAICFLPGHHQIEGDPPTSPELYVGAHWQMADPSFAIARRMERKARISERNRAHQMGWQHFDVSVDKIKEECERHLDDPIIDALRSFSEVTVQNLPSGTRSDNLLRDSMATRKEQTSPASVITGRVFRNEGDMYKFDPLEHPICLSSPRRTVPFQSWRQHVPFAMLLVELLKPRTLVELGVHYGDSYCAFCQAVAELRLGTSCYGVDTWKGDAHASFYGSEVLADLAAHHDPLYGGFSHLIQSTFDEALQHFPDGVIDILHIDGYHTYEAVKHDFKTWLPKVSPRGVILFHDVNEKQKDFGVWRVWDEVKVRYPHFEFLHGHGLGLVAVGERPPEELSWLFEAGDEKAVAIRNFFFCLGDRLTDKMTLSAKQESATVGESELEALQAARTELEAIRSTATWRVAKEFQSFIDAMLPLGTRRRTYVRRALTRLIRPLA